MSQPIKRGQAITIVVTQDLSHQRLDTLLQQSIPQYSRSFFARAIASGSIKVNHKMVSKAGYKLQPGDVIEIFFKEEAVVVKNEQAVAAIKIDIIYEHEHFLIINKPAGLLVHKKHTQSSEPTLVDWITLQMNDMKQVGDVDRPGIVHRLDRDTSGIMVLARTNYAYMQFAKMFAHRTITKQYLAIVQGHLSAKSGTIDLPIGRDPSQRTKMKAFSPADRSKGVTLRQAVTHYTVSAYLQDTTVVAITLETGRMHQIRVHFAAIGHPVVGDFLYNEPSSFIGRQALHAQKLQFAFDGEQFYFEAPVPDDMQKFLAFFLNR